ncbi:glycoside hydrolase family 26 protein [Kocuria sp. SM24M-10]|uniref:glycoside hydrolase family 26 protein n=1 Tax=Kocuria sp. SM24M-10 TaxID=1660349 RepID=UPI00069A51E9|nr:glycosyl hydrolase [Kocuria sp. SM24M-10]
MDIYRPDRRSVLTAALTAVLVRGCAERTTIESLPPHHRIRPLEHGVFLPHGPQDGPAFTAMIGAAPRWMLLFRDWTHEVPPVAALDAVRAQGATPVLTWDPWHAPATGEVPADAAQQPAFALSRFAAGDHNHRISTWASALAAWGHDVVLRFAHEMNGTWYPWAAGVQGNTAEQYVRAWRHVHRVFAAAGATNVRWCWAPNVPALAPDTGGARLADCFPGQDVVDVLGLDGYNWGSSEPPLSWTTPEALFGPGLAQLRGLGARLPIMVTETASAEGHEPAQSKAEWITELFDYLLRQGDVLGVIWFHERKERDWSVDSSAAARTAYRRAVAKLH